MAVKWLFMQACILLQLMQQFSVLFYVTWRKSMFNSVNVETCVIFGCLVSIHLNICQRGLVHGSRGKLAEISMSEVHILTMSQPALFLCSFLTHQGWDWVRQYSPCALLWLDESSCSSTDFLRGCQNHHAHNLQYIRAYLDHWAIPSRGFMDRINFVETT